MSQLQGETRLVSCLYAYMYIHINIYIHISRVNPTPRRCIAHSAPCPRHFLLFVMINIPSTFVLVFVLGEWMFFFRRRFRRSLRRL